MKKFLIASAAAAAIVLLAGCPSGTYSVGDFLEVTVDSDAAELNADGVLDFGMVQAEADMETVSLTITNTGADDISVTSATISDTLNYTLDLPALPGVIAPGETAQYSLSFVPMASGEIPATLSIAAEGSTETADLSITGEGNYSPVPLFGVTVTGAGNGEANGFFERDGFQTAASPSASRRGLYTKNGTPNYHIYIFDASDDDIWGLDDSLDADYPVNPRYSSFDGGTSMLPSTNPDDWTADDAGDDPPPSFTIHDISGTNPWWGETFTATYLYSDEDGDLEAPASAVYQWYRGDSETGSFTPITGELNMTYDSTIADNGKYLKVGITLTAGTGITAGEEVLSDPTIQIVPPEI